MTNKEIARNFNLLAKIMELHNENPFKIRSYNNAYLTIRKMESPLAEFTIEELEGIKGIGKAIASKIDELVSTGEMNTLNKYKKRTPEGIQEMLNIKGFGPKKIRTVWKELGVETAGELMYACQENRLIELKGFGAKSQTDLIKQLEYFLESKGKILYANIVSEAENLLLSIKSKLKTENCFLVGEIVRKLPIVSGIEVLMENKFSFSDVESLLDSRVNEANGKLEYTYANNPVTFYFEDESKIGNKRLQLNASQSFYNAMVDQFNIESSHYKSEGSFFEEHSLPYFPPEIREEGHIPLLLANEGLPHLIEDQDIKGVVHTHSTYSDGLHSVEEMALESMALNYQYLVMSDHSKSAFYANGLREADLDRQWDEIEALNAKYQGRFKIFKGIESDILNDGSLDYEDAILAGFDLIIASIHSNLKMDEQKATARLIRAIENPYTRILGHPTGRLLLSRKGYPIDHKKVIDAAAANNVAIELNSNPYRLDLDWTWIPYAMEKGVLISINPDAHSKSGIKDIHYGICVARKALLTRMDCLNCKDLNDFKAWVSNKV